MDESSRQALLSRRNLLTASAIGTGAVWVAPIVTAVNMASAHAASGPADRAQPGGQHGSGGGRKPPRKPAPSESTKQAPPGTTGQAGPGAKGQPGPGATDQAGPEARGYAGPGAKGYAGPGAPLGPGNNSGGGGGIKPVSRPAPPVTKDRSGGLAKTGE